MPGEAGEGRLQLFVVGSRRCTLRPWPRIREPKLNDRLQPQSEPGFFAARRGPMNHARFGGFVQRRADISERGAGIVLLTAGDQLEKRFLERLQARFGALVVQMLAGAVAHAAFG